MTGRPGLNPGVFAFASIRPYFAVIHARMKRVIQLCIVGALALGVYGYRWQQAEGQVDLCLSNEAGAEERITACSDVLARDSLNDQNRGVVLYQLAVLHGNSDRREPSLRYYNEAAELTPDFPPIFRNRALLHREMGNMDKALSDADLVIARWPGGEAEAASQWVRARVMLHQKQIPAAFAAISRSITLQPGWGGYHELRQCMVKWYENELPTLDVHLANLEDLSYEIAQIPDHEAEKKAMAFNARFKVLIQLKLLALAHQDGLTFLDYAHKALPDPADAEAQDRFRVGISDQIENTEDMLLTRAQMECAGADAECLYRRSAARYGLADLDGAKADATRVVAKDPDMSEDMQDFLDLIDRLQVLLPKLGLLPLQS